MDFNSLVYLGFFCAVAAVNYLLQGSSPLAAVGGQLRLLSL